MSDYSREICKKNLVAQPTSLIFLMRTYHCDDSLSHYDTGPLAQLARARAADTQRALTETQQQLGHTDDLGTLFLSWIARAIRDHLS